MRSSLKLWPVLTLFLGIACLPACTNVPGSTTSVLTSTQSDRGQLEVMILKGMPATRTTQATLADIDSIGVTVSQTGVAPVSKTVMSNGTADASSVTFDNLISGPATVVVSILNSKGVVIGFARNTATILSSKTSSVSFTIQLLPNITNVTTGNGGLSTTITLQDGLEYYNYGVVSTLAGNTQGYKDGVGDAALFNNPNGLTMDAAANLYVADTTNSRIRKITPDGVVTTLAGSTQGYLDGTGTGARFSGVSGLVSDTAGNLYVADSSSNRIRKVTPAGVVSTFAGASVSGKADGVGSAATFYNPTGLAIDYEGTLYVADTGNHRIRKISPNGVVTTLAGGTASGYVDAQGADALFNSPRSVAVDLNGCVYVADTNNNCIRKITPSGEVSTLAGSTTPGFANATGSLALFNQPKGLTIDNNSNLYVADTLNNLIRKVTFDGVVSTIAGQTQSGTLDARGGDAQFYNPAGLFVTQTGKLYVSDTLNHRIRTIE